MLTKEQQSFVFDDKVQSCRLVSVAGAGKTTCVLKRAAHVAERLAKGEVGILCFQRFVADSIRNRLLSDGGPRKVHVHTIDALARRVLVETAPERSKEVRCLSSHFHDILHGEKIQSDKLKECVGELQCIFVDEAQDLNKLQFDLVHLLAKRLGASLVLIGDPNQTIYHFRKACPSFLSSWSDVTYVLPHNFRSCPALVALGNRIATSCLDATSVQAIPVRATDPPEPVRLVCGEPYALLECLVSDLRILAEEGVDLSDACILTPTRGQSDAYPNLGCAQVANYMRVRGVKTSRFYAECGGDVGSMEAYNPRAGRVNVMTVCASKGLEWRYVFLVTPHDEWFNILPSAKDHGEHCYQMYVAVTRAMDRLTLLTVPGRLNRAFACIQDLPVAMRNLTDPSSLTPWSDVLHTSILYNDPDIVRKFRRHHVTQIVANASPATMAYFAEQVIARTMVHKTRQAAQLESTDSAFLGMLCERVFAKAACYARRIHPPSIGIIESWYAGQLVVVPSCHVSVVSKALRGGGGPCPSSVPQEVWNMVSKPRSIPVDRITYALVHPEQGRIVTAYRTYKSPQAPALKCLNSLFLTTLAIYAHSTRHFMYIKGGGHEKRSVLACTAAIENAAAMGEALAKKDSKPLQFSKRLKLYIKQEDCVFIMHGEADVIHDGTAVEIKAAHTTSLDHALQVYLYARMLRPHPKMAKVINVMQGTVTTYLFSDDLQTHELLMDKLLEDVC